MRSANVLQETILTFRCIASQCLLLIDRQDLSDAYTAANHASLNYPS